MTILLVLACTWQTDDTRTNLHPRKLGLAGRHTEQRDLWWSNILSKHEALKAAQAKVRRRAESNEFRSYGMKTAYDFVEPVVSCTDEVRFGSQIFNVGDGPKWVCGPQILKDTPECLIYSVGSDWNFQFEDAITKVAPKCEIHVFDGTMNLTTRPLPSLTPNLKFHNLNVISECEEESAAKFSSKCVQNILHDLGHDKRTITWFKIDCEGCEYSVLPEMLKRAASIDEVFVEVHGTDPARINKLLQQLDESNLFVYHKERNHWGCDGYKCLELSLITIQHARKVYDATFPG